MMFNSKRRRLLLALILLVGNLAISAHGFANHQAAEYAPCELCVAQANTNAVLHAHADWGQALRAYAEFTPQKASAALSDRSYPAWTQRAPPLLY
jgi:hypothetical protein